MSETEGQSLLHAVVYYPDLDSPELDTFRQEHDPFASLIREHLTFVFPIPIRTNPFCDHVRSVASDLEPFDIHIAGLSRSWDHWLYLEIRQGREKVVYLHDRLYTGPFREFLRTDLPYEPHIGIGFFGRGSYDPLDPEVVELDTEAYDTARAAVAELGIEASRRIESITVVKLDKNRLDDVQEIPLGS